MAETKSSGIRQPSKIGRPCCTGPPKPAIPPSPPRTSTTDYMDHLWETHGRRLSEAGLRRGSDTSVVLTEDTDSFIIGDRVWVGGVKPGLIAYIGETQFAPGEWAGVVLDEPIGKNDGSVAGSRYFQCEPKRGIFSRLTRLTRQPLSDAATMPPTGQRTPTSPTESTRGTLNKTMSPSLNTSTTSLSSVSHKELKLGERVIVSSSQGSKTGVLRFLGNTDFAAGEWCGVELDEPLGKNDGSVGEKRYFECRPKYGLFAPMHKVSRSPSNKRSSTCVVHRPTGAALNMSLRKLGSRESLASVSSIASTTASTAMRSGAPSTTREMLKERQQEVEILRKERDLERERVTKAANQADEAEQSLISVKQEYEKYREDMDKTVKEAQAALAKLLDEKNFLKGQLDEERRKCEDLLFRFEEESINRDDIQKERTEQSVTNTLNENKIKELEKQLLEERERVIQLEQDSTKLFEAEEELARLRNELSTTTAHDESTGQNLQNIQQDLERTKISLGEQIKEKDATIERCNTEIKLLKQKLTEKDQESIAQQEALSTLRKELEEAEERWQEKSTSVEKITKEFEDNSETLKKDIQRLKECIENITKGGIKEKEVLELEYKNIIAEKDKVIQSKIEEIEIESKKHLEAQQTNLGQLKDENLKHINLLSATFKRQLDEKDSQIQEISLQLKEKDSTIEKLSVELANYKQSLESKDDELKKLSQQLQGLTEKLKSSEESNELFKRQLDELRSKSKENIRIITEEKLILEKNLAALTNSSADSSMLLNKLNEDLKTKDAELTQLRESKVGEIEEMKKDLENQIANKAKEVEELNGNVAQKSEKLSIFETEISDLKSSVANKDEEIKNLIEKTSEFQNSLKLSDQTKTNLESELRVYESNIESLTQKLTRAEEKARQLTEQKEKLELDIKNLLGTTADSSDQLMKFNDDLRKKEKELDEERDRASQLQSSLMTLDAKLNETEQNLEKSDLLAKELNSKSEDFESQLFAERKCNQELNNNIVEYKEREQELLQTIEKSKHLEEDLKEKTSEVSNLTSQLKESHDEISSLKERYAELENKQQDKVLSLQKQLDELNIKLGRSQEEMNSLQQAKIKLESDQTAKEEALKELTEKYASKMEDHQKCSILISEKDSKIDQMQGKMLELQKEMEDLSAAIHQSKTEYNDSLAQIALLNSNHASSVSEASVQLASVKEQLSHVTSTNESLMMTIETVNKSSEDTKTKLANAMENLRTLQDKLLQAETSNAQKDAKLAELNQTVLSTSDDCTRSKIELHSIKENLKEKVKELCAISTEKLALGENVKSLEDQLKVLEAELSVKNDIVHGLNENIRVLRETEKQSLNEWQLSKETEIQAKQLEIEEIRKQNTQLISEKNDLREALQNQSKDINAKEESIVQLNTKIKALEITENERAKADQESTNKELKIKQNEIDAIAKQNKDLELAKNSYEQQLKEVEEKMRLLSLSIEDREKKTKESIADLTEKLQLAVAESTQLKETQKLLEKEIKQTTAKWEEASETLKYVNGNDKNIETHKNSQMVQPAGDTNRQNNLGKDVTLEKLSEENKLAKGQIEFLNSVIADVHRKNEALMCKVEVLEMGVPANEADDYNLRMLDKRVTTPRMFCDICDQFDLHETEDCPRQAQDFTEPEVAPKPPKKPPVDRPYCENCEIFGHDTRDCDDGETF